MASRVFLRCQHAPSHFRQKIFSKIFGNNPRFRQHAQIIHCQVRQETQHNRNRRGRIPHNRKPYVITLRPLAMVRQSLHHDNGHLLARQRLQHLRFRQVWIFQRDRHHLLMAIRHQHSGHAAWASPREGNLLPQRHLWQPRNDLFFRVALEFHRGRW